MQSSICRALLLIALSILCAAATAHAEPPRVVKASPDNGDQNVDPATRELRVVFDQPMEPTGFSVVGGGPNFPETFGRPRWEDSKTFVMRMRLKPDHQYHLSLNNDTFTNFRSENGEIATPYPISFKTGDAKAPPDPAKDALERNREAAEELRRAIDEDYSYRDLRGVDWEAAFKEATPYLERAVTPRAFADEAAKLLSRAKDAHVWLKVGNEIVAPFQRNVRPNFNPRVLPRLVPNLKQHGTTVLTGRFDDGVVYIAVGTWEAKEPDALEQAYVAIADATATKAPAVLIDVRPNAGGDEILARHFAGCFVDAPKAYSKNTTRGGGQWSQVFDRVVEPNKARPAYRGKVVVLTGPANMSSCESFILMMKQAPDCTLVGEKTYGSSGNPRPRDLGNGVTVFLSSWKDMLPDGSPLEGEGITPDVEAKSTPADFQAADPVLAAALKVARGK